MRYLLCIICLSGLITFHSKSLAVEQTIVGELDGGNPVLLVQENLLMQAFEDELDDGTEFTSVFIDLKDDGYYCLIGIGTLENKQKTCHVYLIKDANDNFRLSTLPIHNSISICWTVDCCNSCDWKACSCKKTIGTCTNSSNQLTSGPGYLGSFY